MIPLNECNKEGAVTVLASPNSTALQVQYTPHTAYRHTSINILYMQFGFNVSLRLDFKL